MSQSIVLGEAIVARYLVEFRFTPFPRILNRSGDLAAEFHGDPFIQWRITSTPFRVELHDQSRTKVAFATHRAIGMEMEAPDTFSMFSDQVQRWLRTATVEKLFGDLQVLRSGFRAWYFTPVSETAYEGLVNRISKRFLIIDPLLDAFSSHKVVDNAVVLNLASPESKIDITLGPITKDEARRKEWVNTDEGQGILPELALAIDIDLFQERDVAEATPVNSMLKFIRDSWKSSELINSTFVDMLRG